jgi:tetratricopeptide (TPR) repeat protein
VAANLVAGQPDAAIAAYARARQIDSSLGGASANTLNDLCRRGSLAGRAAAILDACERAVALAPDDGGIRDSRGLARALTGDTSGAIADFQAFIVWAPQHDQGDRVAQRQDWIAALKAGRNPFDAQTLERIKSQ